MINDNSSVLSDHSPSNLVLKIEEIAIKPSNREGHRKVIFATSLGNALEIFDFTVFSFFASIIGRQYFPVDSASGQLLLALATFGVGFLARPLGGVLIGSYADRRGRKPALSLTIVLMTVGTGLIGLSPTYAQIGLFAPVLIVAGRLLQGLSAGGEVGTATAFLMESGSKARRGFMVSWQVVSQGVATIMGAACAALLSEALSPESLLAWGWRVPFIIGLAIGPVGFYIRRNFHETHSNAALSPFKDLLRNFPGKLLHGVLMIVGVTTSMFILGFYMPLYAVKSLHLPVAASYLSSCASGAAIIIGALIAGQVIDRMKRRKALLLFTSGLMLLTIYPTFALINLWPSVGLLVAIAFFMMLIGTVGSSAFFLIILELFPPAARVTGLSIVYALGVTVFGGFAQFNVTWLLQRTGNSMSIAWYLLATVSISLIALLMFRESVQDGD